MAAAKKKPKAKVKRKKAPAGKAPIRKKSKPLKKVAAKKPAKRAAPKPAAPPPVPCERTINGRLVVTADSGAFWAFHPALKMPTRHSDSRRLWLYARFPG